MASPFMRAFIKTKNINILNYYHNINKKYIFQKGGNNVQIDDFIFNEQFEYDTYNNNLNNNAKKSIQIFIGSRNDCLIGKIELDEPHIAYIQYFGYGKHCNIYSNLEKTTGTKRMMLAFFKFIVKKHPEVKIIKLTDEATTNCSDISIDLYKLYILKYGVGFYEKQFDFQVEEQDNMPYILDIHEQNKIKSKNIKIDKQNIKKILNTMFNSKYNDNDNKNNNNNVKLVNEFVNDINDDELVSMFLARYKAPEKLCKIFDGFINIIFNLHLQTLPQPLIYYITIDNIKSNRKIFPKHTKTLKHLSRSSNRKTKKTANLLLKV